MSLLTDSPMYECPRTGIKWCGTVLLDDFMGWYVRLEANVVIDHVLAGGVSNTIFHLRNKEGLWTTRRLNLHRGPSIYVPNVYITSIADHDGDVELRPLPQHAIDNLPKWYLATTGYLYEVPETI